MNIISPVQSHYPRRHTEGDGGLSCRTIQPRKFIVLTFSALLTRNLLAIAKIIVATVTITVIYN